jgi:hypothetical protein
MLKNITVDATGEMGYPLKTDIVSENGLLLFYRGLGLFI